ncbi:MAG: hypothetical protein K2R93_11145 [Gemmatimonadaceae bacterium]|nr:hypothetical protein [Gemmatimonadaceae bacterium]
MTQRTEDDLTPDPRLRDALLAVDRAPTLDVAALRTRILAAAAPQLAARRQPPSWWDVTSRAGRFLIPASLAAAALALLLLRQAPAVGGATEVLASQTASSIAIETPDDVEAMSRTSTEQLMPSDAESWLLGEQGR